MRQPASTAARRRMSSSSTRRRRPGTSSRRACRTTASSSTTAARATTRSRSTTTTSAPSTPSSSSTTAAVLCRRRTTARLGSGSTQHCRRDQDHQVCFPFSSSPFPHILAPLLDPPSEPDMFALTKSAQHPSGKYVLYQCSDNSIVAYSSGSRFRQHRKKRGAATTRLAAASGSPAARMGSLSCRATPQAACTFGTSRRARI